MKGPQTPKGKALRRSTFSDISKVAQRIKEHVDIIEVMENAGIEFVSKNETSAGARCFIHQDGDPSLVVSVKKGLFNCFGAGCKAGGDAINFYMQYHRVDFATACLALIEDFGIDVSDLSKAPTEDQIRRWRLIDANDKITDFLHSCLLKSQRALGFAAKRGFKDKDTLRQFKIGYSASTAHLQQGLSRMGVSRIDAKELEMGSKVLFTDRILYPIQSMEGSTLTFYGRRLGEEGPKYVGMSSSHPLIDKDMPYGLVHARQSVANGLPLVLVEGHNDVLVAHANGITNVAGMHGSAPTKGMYGLIESCHIRDIVVCPDADAAGDRTIRDISESRSKDCRVRIASIPSAGDPDEFIRSEGVERFNEVIEAAKYPIEIFVSRIAERMGNTTTSKLEAVNTMADHMRHLSGFDRELAVQELSTMTGIEQERIDAILSDMGDADLINYELEVQLLSECMNDRMKTITLMSKDDGSIFTSARHKRVFDLIRAMVEEDISPFTREMALAYGIDKSLIKQEDMDAIPKDGLSGRGVEYTIEVLQELAKRRILKKAAESLDRSVKIGKQPVDDILASHMRAISTHSTSKHLITKAEDHIITVMDKIHERIAHPGIPGVHIGPKWKKFMNQIMGFQPGHMLSVAGISKAGKTTIAQNWCIEQLHNGKESTLWINLEMSELDITIRNLAIMTGIESQRLKIGNISKIEKQNLDDASAEYHGFPLYVASMGGGSIYDVVNVMRNYVYSKGVRIVFIDYIQLISSGGRSAKESLWEAQNEVVAQIREAISQLKITGVVISQLNRGAMAAESASGQYVSGTIKLIQDSDAFMGIRSKTKAEMVDTPHSNASLLIEFNRHGPQNSQIDLNFNYASSQVEEA